MAPSLAHDSRDISYCGIEGARNCADGSDTSLPQEGSVEAAMMQHAGANTEWNALRAQYLNPQT